MNAVTWYPPPPTFIYTSEPAHRLFEATLKAFYAHRIDLDKLYCKTKKQNKTKTKANEEKTKPQKIKQNRCLT